MNTNRKIYVFYFTVILLAVLAMMVFDLNIIIKAILCFLIFSCLMVIHQQRYMLPKAVLQTIRL